MNPIGDLREQISHNLSKHQRIANDDAELGKAAVVIAVEYDADSTEQANFILTRRTSKLRKHPGQYALPGGKLDQGETVHQAALRELEEELGITVEPDQVLGLLDDYPTQSGFCITPVVVWLAAGVQLRPNPDEVARAFRVPISDLSQEDLLSLDQTYLSIHLAEVGHDIYPPTAAVIYQFYQVAILGQETRVVHFEQPRFTWR